MNVIIRVNVVFLSDKATSAITLLNIINDNAYGYVFRYVVNSDNVLEEYNKWKSTYQTSQETMFYFVDITPPVCGENIVYVKDLDDYRMLEFVKRPQLWPSQIYLQHIDSLYNVYIKKSPILKFIEMDYKSLGLEQFIQLYLAGLNINIQNRLKNLIYEYKQHTGNVQSNHSDNSTRI